MKKESIKPHGYRWPLYEYVLLTSVQNNYLYLEANVHAASREFTNKNWLKPLKVNMTGEFC